MKKTIVDRICTFEEKYFTKLGIYNYSDSDKVTRRKNELEHLNYFLKILKNIRKINVTRSSKIVADNSSELVLTITDYKSNHASLWIHGSKVRSITPY